MGAKQGCHGGDGEEPVRRIQVSGYRLSACTVTNAQFRNFVEATDHQTTAEAFGWSFVFDPTSASLDQPGS